MQISVSAPKAPAQTASANSISTSNVSANNTPSMGEASAQVDYQEQAASATQGSVTQESEVKNPVANEQAVNMTQSNEIESQALELENLTASLEVAFPQLTDAMREQITQWMAKLQQGEISPQDLIAKLQTQLKNLGVNAPAPAMAMLEGMFEQVAKGELSLPQLADTLTLLGRQLRHTSLESFSKQFGDNLFGQADSSNPVTAPAERKDAVSLLVDIKSDIAPRQVAAMPELMLAMNEAAPERMLITGLQPQQVQTRPAAMMPSSQAASLPQQLDASVDISQPEWGRDLVDQLRTRLRFNAQDNIQMAHVRLDPPELGKLEITLRMEGDKVNVHIAAAHPQLREALSAHADRLRMDIEQSQLQLADVSVSSGLQQGQGESKREQESNRTVMGNPLNESATFSSPSLSGLGRYESVV